MAVYLTEIALGIDMHANRLQHRIRKHTAQKRQGQVLVQIVYRYVLGQNPGQQMPKVMQQGCRHQFGASPRALSQVGTLQGMLLLADRLQAVTHCSLGAEQLRDLVYGERHFFA